MKEFRLDEIPFERALLYVMGALFLPIILLLGMILFNLSSTNALEERITSLKALAEKQQKKGAINATVRLHFRDADHFYIDKNLETLKLLEPEVEALQKIVQNKNFTEDEVIKKRLEFLTGPQNALRFSEGVVETHPKFQETEETLVHPVEANLLDLQKILSLVEGVSLGTYKPQEDRPQLIILDFKIDKKANQDKNEVFLLNLKLLKREYL